jgi:hypothetical protein
MKSGELIQIQRPIRVRQCGPHVMNGLDDYFTFPSLHLQPGEIYLMTDFYKAEEDYPIYNYFEFTILAAGQQWEATITIDHDNEIDDFIQVFESPTLLPRG